MSAKESIRTLMDLAHDDGKEAGLLEACVVLRRAQSAGHGGFVNAILCGLEDEIRKGFVRTHNVLAKQRAEMRAALDEVADEESHR